MPAPVRIGLVFDFNLAYPRGVLRGIKKYGRAKPHWILVVHDSDSITRRTLQTMHCDGLIAYVVSQKMIDVLAAHDRPVVNVSSLLAHAPFPRVSVNHRQVGRLAFRHFTDCGLKHFGCVGHVRHLYALEREAGFRDALVETSFSYERFFERRVTSIRHRARLLALNADFQKWLRQLPKPAGVFATHDVWGVQVIEACRLIGLRVPDDVAVIGVDNDDLLCEIAQPSLSSIIVSAEQVGFESAAMLQRLLSNARPPRRPHLVPPAGLVVRQSSDLLAGGDADLKSAVRFIRNHGNRPIRVADVLREVPVSRRLLEQKFRAVLARGIGEEIRRVHLERAKDLLATTTLSVSEVADQAGFAGVQYLSYLFRRATGQTPTSFRRQFYPKT